MIAAVEEYDDDVEKGEVHEEPGEGQAHADREDGGTEAHAPRTADAEPVSPAAAASVVAELMPTSLAAGAGVEGSETAGGRREPESASFEPTLGVSPCKVQLQLLPQLHADAPVRDAIQVAVSFT